MLATSIVEEIKALLSEKRLSQRRIAEQLGVSRNTVGAIARGKRPDYSQRNRKIEPIVVPSGRPKRCPGCGGLVQLPCLRCQLHVLKPKGRDGGEGH